MKHVYKLAAIAIVGITLISAQGVEAQPPKNKQSKHENFQKGKDQNYYKGQNKHYDRGDKRSRGHGNKYGHYKHQYEYKARHNRGRYDRRGRHGHFNKHYGHFNNVGRVVVHRGRAYKMQNGVFFATNYGRWVPAPAPVGLRVMQLPYGTRVIRTRVGPLYECRGTFYTEASRGIGFIVTNAPRGVHEYRGSW